MVFFVHGLSVHGRELLINPDQVLHIHAAGIQNERTVIVQTHGKRLMVDQNIQMVRKLFDDYLRSFAESHDDDPRFSELSRATLKVRTRVLSS